MDAPHLQAGDLDPTDKQNWGAVQRIFSVETLGFLANKGDNSFYIGTFGYVLFSMRLMDAWLADTQRESPRQCIKDAAFSHGFVIFWRWWIATSDRGETLSMHFITRETFLDTVTSSGTAINRFPLFRDHYPKYSPIGNRFASRFDEYCFQFSRMRQKNAPSFGVKGFLTHMRHYTCQSVLAAEGQWETPSAKRGVAHKPSVPGPNQAPYHPSDNELLTWVDEGLNEAMMFWMKELGVEDVVKATNPDEFYAAPVKHFPWHEAHRDPSFEEILEENENGEGPIDVDINDEEDNNEAARLIDHLVRVAPRRGNVQLPQHDPFHQSIEEIGAVIVELNASIQKEAYERRYRFRVTRLFKQRALPGAVLRTEDDRDYISDDDDVAVMFYDDNDKPYIVLGNIEDIAHSSTVVDKSKLADTNYLARLEKSYRSLVPTHDGDALFVIRWYDEADRNFRIMEGYQNRGVQNYHLPLDMQEPFRWYSNWQVLCPVHLKKVETHQGMYKLSPKDWKTLKAELQKAGR